MKSAAVGRCSSYNLAQSIAEYVIVSYRCWVIQADVYHHISSIACTSVVDITCSKNPTCVDYILRVFALSTKDGFL